MDHASKVAGGLPVWGQQSALAIELQRRLTREELGKDRRRRISGQGGNAVSTREHRPYTFADKTDKPPAKENSDKTDKPRSKEISRNGMCFEALWYDKNVPRKANEMGFGALLYEINSIRSAGIVTAKYRVTFL